MKVDKDDIPLLIQHMKYDYGYFSFDVEFFNGTKHKFCAELVCPSLDIMERPTKMQWLEALNNIEKISLANWKELNASINRR